jgi:DNA-binding transcriptional MerR regulator
LAASALGVSLQELRAVIQAPEKHPKLEDEAWGNSQTAAGQTLDVTTCSQCLESRKLADDAMATLREIKAKYGLGDRHLMREKNREIEKLREALKDATELLGEIMRDEVNHQDEAEKWLRAYGEICSNNV